MEKELEVKLTKQELLDAVSEYLWNKGVKHAKILSVGSMLSDQDKYSFWLDIDNVPKTFLVKRKSDGKIFEATENGEYINIPSLDLAVLAKDGGNYYGGSTPAKTFTRVEEN